MKKEDAHYTKLLADHLVNAKGFYDYWLLTSAATLPKMLHQDGWLHGSSYPPVPRTSRCRL